jgi:hypothetical protein
MSFTVKTSEKEGKTLLQFCGQIDEEATFPEVNDSGKEVFIDLKEVSSINSIGIRSWILWFAKMQTTTFNFINCPKALVMQMNMVEGFLPEKSNVISLNVPFFCEDCDKEIEKLFVVGKEIQVIGDQVSLKYDKTLICESGCNPELDVNESKFFRFLLSKSSSQAA